MSSQTVTHPRKEIPLDLNQTGAPDPAEQTLLFEIPGLRWTEADARRARQAVPEVPVDILTAISEHETWIYVSRQQVSDLGTPGDPAAFLARLLGTSDNATQAFRLRRLQALLSIGDAAQGGLQPWHYTSQTDIPVDDEDEFNQWFDREHLPRLAAVTGTAHATRYRTDGSPRYLAGYDLSSEDVHGNDAWRDAVATPWRDRIHQKFVKPRRLMLKRLR